MVLLVEIRKTLISTTSDFLVRMIRLGLQECSH